MPTTEELPLTEEDLLQKTLEYRGKDPKRVIAVCTDIIHTEEQSNKKVLGFSLFYRGESYYIINKTEEMFQDLTKAVPLLEQTAQWELLARSYNLLAIVSLNKGNSPVAVDYYLEGLHCANTHKFSTMTTRITLNLGVLYMHSGLFEDAEHYFLEAYKTYQGFSEATKKDMLRTLTIIYTNLSTCYMLCGALPKAAEYIDRIEKECRQHFNAMDHIYVDCMEARYYDACKEYAKRDEKLSSILVKISAPIPYMDLFDDLYDLCKFALQIKRLDIFRTVTGLLHPALKQAQMLNLEKLLLSLEIPYYKELWETEGDGDAHERYRTLLERFFELSTVVDAENSSMVSSMLKARNHLERLEESKRKIEQLNAILEEKAETDPLTGISNRYHLTEYSQKALDKCLKEQSSLSIEILDVDFFKEYNDNYGHQAGDVCLQKIAGLLKEMQEENIHCARYGGDEFILIYAGFSPEEIYKRANELRKKVASLNITHAYSKAERYVTISQGICTDIPAEENRSWDYLSGADNYLYQVKRRSRNSICVGTLHGKVLY